LWEDDGEWLAVTRQRDERRLLVDSAMKDPVKWCRDNTDTNRERNKQHRELETKLDREKQQAQTPKGSDKRHEQTQHI